MEKFSENVSFIWSVADLLRGDYKPSEYGRVILPFLVLRRLDQVLAPTRKAVLDVEAKQPADKTPEGLRERMLLKASGETFYSMSKLDFATMLDDPGHAAANLAAYVHGFSKNVRGIMAEFRFGAQGGRSRTGTPVPAGGPGPLIGSRGTQDAQPSPQRAGARPAGTLDQRPPVYDEPLPNGDKAHRGALNAISAVD
ncbi:hypothetical protein DRQ53_12230 [bacterium]|nr:MAG: hypothetical protein DRQ53_12230 [bacterium]